MKSLYYSLLPIYLAFPKFNIVDFLEILCIHIWGCMYQNIFTSLLCNKVPQKSFFLCCCSLKNIHWAFFTHKEIYQFLWLLNQGCILAPCLFNFYAEYIMRNTGWMKHKLESRLPGEMSITSDMQMIPPLWQKVRETKNPLDESERGEWKSWLKAQHSEN